MLIKMMDDPVYRLGGISYLRIPATDARQSAAFYRAVFGWKLHGPTDHPSFQDGTGHVIGAWQTDLAAVGEAGILPYVYVDSVPATLDKVLAQGGAIAKHPYLEGNLTVATVRDVAGNVIGIWQQTTQPSE